MKAKLSNNLSTHLSKNIDPVEYAISVSSGETDFSVTSLFDEVANSIFPQSQDSALIHESNIDRIISILWNFKCLEGQFNPQSRFYVVYKVKKYVNQFRRGVGWIFCRRLQKCKRSVFRHYLKEFIHDIVRDQNSEKERRNSFQEENEGMKEREDILIDKIVEKCIYIPPSGNRHHIKIVPFHIVEDVINQEVGDYLYLQEKIKEDLWKVFRYRIRNALIALFAGLGILEMSIAGIIL